jgi:signal recognition particle receptor subunit beta
VALINRAGQEVSAKVVYYGPGLSGKTTNLEVLFRQVPEDHRGKMISMKTRTDRTLFFDLLPLTGDAILDFNVRILLYTVPGQVYYNATRRLVLKGVDAVVFVADSQRGKMEENLESLENLRSNLADMNLKLEDLPWVIQYNKRDLPDVLSVQELEQALNPTGVPCFNAVAPRGEGVQETLSGITEHLRPRLRALVEKELGESLRSAPPASPSRSTPPAPLPPRELAPPQLRGLDAPVQRSGLELDHLPDPRVVELTPGQLRSPHPKPGTPIDDLMQGGDVRRALREVETSIDASPLRSLADTLPTPSLPAARPFTAAGASAPDRQALDSPLRPVSRVVPEIVELDAQPSAPPRPAAPRPQAPWASPSPLPAASTPAPPPAASAPPAPPPAPAASVAPAPPAASAPPAPPPALWASAPPLPPLPAPPLNPTPLSAEPPAMAPPVRVEPARALRSEELAVGPSSGADGATLTVRIPRSALSQGEVVLRLVIEDAPAPAATPRAGLMAGGSKPPAWMASAAAPREEPAAGPVTRSMAGETQVGETQASEAAAAKTRVGETQAGAAPEPLTVGAGRSASAPGRPAGAGMRFALRNGELVPLD